VYSSCTVSHIRRYFHTGELPGKGTVCEPDELPFGDANELELVGEVAVDVKKMYQEGHSAMLRSMRGLPGVLAEGGFTF
jgi:hypothetical protein